MTNGGARHAAVLTSDTSGWEEPLLALEASASAAYNRFVFDTEDEARDFRAFLFARGAAEYSPPSGRLLLVAGEPAGMLALLDAQTLRQRRIRAALEIARAPRYSADAALQRRLQLAARTLHPVKADEACLARIAVSDRFNGRGLGQWMLDHAIEDARNWRARALVLDVAEDNQRAIEFYVRSGFAEIGRASTSDEASGRTLGNLHLSKSL